MKTSKIINYLISVTKGGKVVALHWSHNLVELFTIKLLHPGSTVEVTNVSDYMEKREVVPVDEEKERKRRLSRNGRPYANRIRCIETNNVFESVPDCADKMGIPRVSIYVAIRRNIAAYGYHFEYLPPKTKEEE